MANKCKICGAPAPELSIKCEYCEQKENEARVRENTETSYSNSSSSGSSYRRSYFYWGYDASTRFKRTFKFIFLGIAGIVLGGMVDSTEIAAGSLVIFGGLAALNFIGSIYAFIVGE